MEKKIGKNVSSGAEKVEKIEEYTAETVNEPVKKTTTKKTSAKKTTAAKTAAKKPSAKRAALTKAEKAEKAAAEKRLKKAKAKEEAKEEKKANKIALKQKKLEKKAEIKQKKLDKKAMVAEKKAERKQKKLDKKAALREKRVEKKAERAARRELLKNETKAERQKRLEREKRERVALKRQKAASREKAREEKIKSRREAHARKASDRKHRREQRTARKENRRGFGGWLAAVISLGVATLVLGTVVTAGAFRLNDMASIGETGARTTLYELVSVSEDMDNNLSKLRVSSGVDEQRRLLTDILVDSALIESAMERLPVDAATSTDISGFVNDTNAFAESMLTRLSEGKTLTEREKSRIADLYNVNAKISSELNALATHMSSNDVMDFITGNAGTMSESFGSIGGGIREKIEEIADAPFAKEGNIGKNKLTELPEITEAEAEQKTREYFSAYHVADVRFTGETSAQEAPCYNFVVTDENGMEIFAEITKNGGKLAFFDSYEQCTEKNFELATCDGLAKEFLAGLGIGNVEAVWLSDAGMVANLTYVTIENGVRIYPEIIRVRVCESKGRVIGVDARGYLLNDETHATRAKLSEAEAKELLSGELEVTSSNLAVIPVGDVRTLCYEFACNAGEEQFIVYLDANTGAEVQIFRVKNSATGSYLE